MILVNKQPLLIARNSSFVSERFALPVLASRLILTIGRETSSGQPIIFRDASKLATSLRLRVGREDLQCIGSTIGGVARYSRSGTEIAAYALNYGLSWGFFGTRGGMPRRLGEERIDIDTLVEIALDGEPIDSWWSLEVLEEAAPQVAFHSSVAWDVSTDASETNDANATLSFSHAGGSGSDRAAFVAAFASDATVPSIDAATYGGNSMTAAHASLTSNDLITGRAFYLAGIPTGTQTVADTLSASGADGHGVTCTTMTGVDQTTPVGSPATSVTATLTPSATVGSVGADDLVVDGVFGMSDDNSAGSAAGANQTERTDESIGASMLMASSTQLGADGGVMSWTIGAGSSYGTVLTAIAFKTVTVSNATGDPTGGAATAAVGSMLALPAPPPPFTLTRVTG